MYKDYNDDVDDETDQLRKKKKIFSLFFFFFWVEYKNYHITTARCDECVRILFLIKTPKKNKK